MINLYLFKEEKLNLNFNPDPVDFQQSYENNGAGGVKYLVFEMETVASNFQQVYRDDPEQKQFCADLVKRLDLENLGAKKNLKISLGVPTKEVEQAIIEIDGEFLEALDTICVPPKQRIEVKLSALTSLANCSDVFCTCSENIRKAAAYGCDESRFWFETNDMAIKASTDDNLQENCYCNFFLGIPSCVRSQLMDSTGEKIADLIRGLFSIEISLHNFEEKLVSPQTLTETLLNEAVSTDAVIRTGDGTEIQCHRCFLIVNSNVLKAMLESTFEERGLGKIEMPEMSAEGVKALLAFLYCRDLEPAKKKSSVAWELLNAAVKYEIVPLRKSMEKVFLRISEDCWWTVEVALQVYAFMDKFDSEWELRNDLKKKILGIMNRNHSKWMSSDFYQKMLIENPVFISDLLTGCFTLSMNFAFSNFKKKE